MRCRRSGAVEDAFPLGGMQKPEVREIAHAAGLPVFDKRDSTGICFIGERPFQRFPEAAIFAPRRDRSRLPRAGSSASIRGLALHTLGQRSGLKIGGRAGAAAAPWYVADKIVERNALVVVQDQYHPLLLSDEFSVEQIALDQSRRCTGASNGMRGQDPLSAERSGLFRCARAAAAHWAGDAGSTGAGCHARPVRRFLPGRALSWGGIIAQRFNSELAPEARGIPYNSLFSMEGS